MICRDSILIVDDFPAMTTVPSLSLAKSKLMEAKPGIRILSAYFGPPSVVIAATLLGIALNVNFGQYHPAALCWLTLAILACFAGCVGIADIRYGADACAGTRRLVVTLAICLAIQFSTALRNSPGATLIVRSSQDVLPFRIGILLAAGISVFVLAGLRFQKIALFAIVSVHFLIGLWLLHVTPPPGVDVCVFQQGAADALLHGHNPYAITFAIPYADPGHVYAPGTFANGRLMFGYPYPPLSLLLVLPGALLGDFRFAHLFATSLAGLFMGLSRPGRIATAAASLFLFTPRGFFVIEAGWTEPLVVLLLSALIFAACRKPMLTPLFFSLLVITKQYLILVIPLALLLRNRDSLRENRSSRNFNGASVLIGLILSLPFALWDVQAFMKSVVWLQFRQPMRMDALSYAPWFFAHLGMRLPMWVPFLAVACVTWFALKLPRTPAAFAAAVGLIFLLFFALNKQAFCNYYHFVVGAFCCSVAAIQIQYSRSGR